ncbi:MAG: GIY-YIG nuclease family protein, partial [Lentisphaeraceae bacterium]|nr:GIY-YIG nuclease family protein [Lentisphaeraceae bacterium]
MTASIKAQTIQIFLPGGDANGIRIADITNLTVQIICIPRKELSEALKRPECSNVGIYFLFGEDEENGKERLYIGEGEDCAERLRDHHKKRNFWTHALVCVSKTQFFTKAHVKFLEHLIHQEAERAGRYILENSNTPTRSHISESARADLLGNFETIKTLCATLGYKPFAPLSEKKDRKLYTCKGKQASAQADYTSEGFIVLKGSLFQKETTKSMHKYMKVTRQQLIDQGRLIDNGETWKLIEDVSFKSPSTA